MLYEFGNVGGCAEDLVLGHNVLFFLQSVLDLLTGSHKGDTVHVGHDRLLDKLKKTCWEKGGVNNHTLR